MSDTGSRSPCYSLSLSPQLSKKARPAPHARALYSNQVEHLPEDVLSAERCAFVTVPGGEVRLGIYCKSMLTSCYVLPRRFERAMQRVESASGDRGNRPYGVAISLLRFQSAMRSQIDALFVAKTQVSLSLVHSDSGASGGRPNASQAYPKEAFRLVHGDSDGLPGIVVDAYPGRGNVLPLVVVQSSSPVGEFLFPYVEAALKELFSQAVLFERSTGQGRKLLGLEERVRVLQGDLPEEMATTFCGLGLNFRPDACQKTGLFLDQRANLVQLGALLVQVLPRQGSSALAPVEGPTSTLQPPLRILDLCCYAGAWSAQIASTVGTRGVEVTLVDQDLRALRLAERNVRANAAHHATVSVEALCGDVFEHLAALAKTSEGFDIVIADPPAFAKSRKHVPEARRAYARLNRLAQGLVEPGGILITCSCSRNMEMGEFREIVEDQLMSATRAMGPRSSTGSELQESEWIRMGTGSQSIDHTIPVGAGVSDYLKCFFYQRRILKDQA